MNNDVAIKVENVSKSFKLPHQKAGSIKHLVTNPLRTKRTYEVQNALKNIDLEIKKGEFFGIVGRNGSGKSTLLKILAGIYQPTKGKVAVHGKLVPFIELGVGFNPELTGRENVYLNGALLGFSEKEIAAMYDDIVEFAELEKFMDQKLKNYSSGMQVRLAFSMATKSQADILLIDEVLAVGDADFQRKCFAYFKKLKKSNTTVIFVSHDMDAVREYCDRVALIEQSEIAKVGSSEAVATLYSRLFIEGNVTEEKGGKKWGDGSADILKPTVSLKNGKVEFSYEVKALDNLEDALYGFAMRDATGLQIIGSNSKINQDPKLTVKKASKVKVVHYFDDVFSDGSYVFDIAVETSDGLTVCCWWQEAISVSIKKTKRVSAILDYPIKTVLELEK
jgi:ABC-2 type transport system ATP-binding protein